MSYARGCHHSPAPRIRTPPAPDRHRYGTIPASKRREARTSCVGSLQAITAEDRNEFQEQIEAEQDAYEAIKDLHDKILRLLREKPQAKAATNHR